MHLGFAGRELLLDLILTRRIDAEVTSGAVFQTCAAVSCLISRCKCCRFRLAGSQSSRGDGAKLSVQFGTPLLGSDLRRDQVLRRQAALGERQSGCSNCLDVFIASIDDSRARRRSALSTLAAASWVKVSSSRRRRPLFARRKRRDPAR